MSTSIHNEDQPSYRSLGFCLLSDAFLRPDQLAQDIASRVTNQEPIFVSQEDRVVQAGKGFLRHRAIDRFGCDEIAPLIGQKYASLLPIVSEISEQKLALSPYDRSAYYAKIYDPPGDQQGWHFDTNNVSVIVYLTSNPSDGGTEIQSPNGKSRTVQPVAGTILVLDGTRCWHRALPVTIKRKITLLMNYYTEPIAERDPRLDGIIFGIDRPVSREG